MDEWILSMIVNITTRINTKILFWLIKRTPLHLPYDWLVWDYYY